jgi:hypothetical protein
MQESLDSPSAYIINFDTLAGDIQEMVQQQGFSNDEVVTALARRGFQTSTRGPKRRLASWNIRRERVAGEVSDALAEEVDYLFHHYRTYIEQCAFHSDGYILFRPDAGHPRGLV